MIVFNSNKLIPRIGNSIVERVAIGKKIIYRDKGYPTGGELHWFSWKDWFVNGTREFGGFVMCPDVDITFTTMTMYTGDRKNDGDGCPYTNFSCFVAEMSEPSASATVTTIMDYTNASEMHYASNTGEGEWVAAASNSVYGLKTALTIEGTEVTAYKFTSKLASGDTITLKAGHYYMIGMQPNLWNSNGNCNLVTLQFKHNTNTNKFATTRYSNPETHIQTFDAYSDTLWNIDQLPYILFDDVVFTKFRFTAPVRLMSRTIYNTLNDIKKCVKSTEKLILILRNGDMSVAEPTQTDELSDLGVSHATRLGNWLNAVNIDPNDCIYGATDYYGPCETGMYIATGHGDTDYSTADAADIYAMDSFDTHTKVDSRLSVLWQGRYTSATPDDTSATDWKVSWGNVVNTAWDYNLEERMVAEVNALIGVVGAKKFGVFCTQDYHVVPLISYASDRNLDLYYNDGIWVNYLTGVAIIVNADGTFTNADGTYRIYPVTALSSGTAAQ